MPENKLARVVGMGSSLPLDPTDPRAPANRRISILVMTKEAEERLLGAAQAPADAETDTPNANSVTKTTP